MKREAEEDWAKGKMAVIGKNRIMIYGPKNDGTVHRRVQDHRRRGAGDLNPPPVIYSSPVRWSSRSTT
jgi:hypothetical protein